MKMILGKKVGMTQNFLEDGRRIPVTIIQADPNVVLENKTKEKNTDLKDFRRLNHEIE